MNLDNKINYYQNEETKQVHNGNYRQALRCSRIVSALIKRKAKGGLNGK